MCECLNTCMEGRDKQDRSTLCDVINHGAASVVFPELGLLSETRQGQRRLTARLNLETASWFQKVMCCNWYLPLWKLGHPWLLFHLLCFWGLGKQMHCTQLLKFLLYRQDAAFIHTSQIDKSLNIMLGTGRMLLIHLLWQDCSCCCLQVILSGSYRLPRHVTATNKSNGARELPHDFNDN